MGPQPTRTTVSPEVQAWIAANLLRGAPRAELVRVMAGRGVAPDVAERAIEEAAGQAAFRAAAPYANAVRRLAANHELDRLHRAFAPDDAVVDVVETLDEPAFREGYLAKRRPVVLTGALAGMPALGKWTPEWFKAAYGDVPVKVTLHREADPLYQPNEDAHMAEMPLGAFVDMVLAAGETNDFYLTGRMRTFHQADLAGLLADLAPAPPFVRTELADGSHMLWFGPAGTVTPLHHDPGSVLFCQLYGRKRVHLIRPDDLAMALYATTYYSPIDAERPDFGRYPELAGTEICCVELGPGDSLFIPVGWWHQVRGLTVSISVTFGGLPYPGE